MFGKDKMATFERYFLADKETHREEKNPYYCMLEDENTVGRILEEFGLSPQEGHIVNGHVPRDDIPFLVQNVLCSINKSAGTQTAISPEAIERLKRHTWNGNIRELKNILEKLCILSDGIRFRKSVK